MWTYHPLCVHELSPHASVVVALLPLLFSRLPTWEASIDSLLLAMEASADSLPASSVHNGWLSILGVGASVLATSWFTWQRVSLHVLYGTGCSSSGICGTLCLTSRSSRWSMTLGFLSRRGLWMERGVTITPRQAMPLGISGTFIVSLSSKVFVC